MPATPLTRRRFTQLAVASAMSCSLPFACSSRSPDYTDEDAGRLAAQKAEEAARSGKGPLGPLRFRGYRGLAELPYFRLGDDRLLHLTLEPKPEIIDFHVHLGMTFLFARRPDLLRRTPRTRYYLDCDRDDPPCPVDLDVYVNGNFTPALHRYMSHEIRAGLLFGSRAAETHTIPNLLAEMNAAGVQRAAILPVHPGLPFRSDPTPSFLDAIGQAEAHERLIPFAAVHPRDRNWRRHLEAYARQGVRGLKLHPEMQRFFPDDPAAMEIYEACGRLGLPIIFHAGRSGIEPVFMRKYALIRRYVEPIRTFPQVRFVLGHAGARDVADAVPLARRHDNIWLEVSGQGATQLRELIREVGAEKLLFGTDWPFYPEAVTLAKVLLATEGNPHARRAILAGNAVALLG